MSTTSEFKAATLWNSTNVWVNSMKLVTLATVPDILPFFQQNWETPGTYSVAGIFTLVIGRVRADLAAESAFSLPGIFT